MSTSAQTRPTRRPAGPRTLTSGRSARPTAVLAAVLTALLLVALAAPDARAAGRIVPVTGAGSTWSQVAIQQWATNVNRLYGWPINYQGTGSSDGRKQFANQTVDFGVSEIPYGLSDAGVVDSPPARPFGYMPIVAGGTSFMYNLHIGGRQVTTLRLDGATITKIFTNVVTRWNDPAIQSQNPGLRLPARTIVPVVRSDGSGTTAQFSLWMSKRYAPLWDAYCSRAGRSTPCGQTSNYPLVGGSRMVAQALSTGVAGYVKDDANGEGGITYVEYAYALDARKPVVSLLNTAGFYVQPTAGNVAVALLGARINRDLTQNLDGVYANPDARAYPLSSYSYMLVPQSVVGSFSTDKGWTLSKFASYFLCQGQKIAGKLGYSPLPTNLVQAAFAQVAKIPNADTSGLSLAGCDNPAAALIRSTPRPAACDRPGPQQCGTSATGGATGGSTGGSSGGTAGGTTGGNGSGGGSTRGGSTGGGSTGNGGGGGSTGTAGSGSSTAAGSGAAGAPGAAGGAVGGATAGGAAGAGVTVDPDTGAVVPAPGGATGAGGGTALAAGANGSAGIAGTVNVAGAPISLASDYTGSGARTVLMVVACMLLLGTALVPPLLARRSAARAGR